MPPLHSRATRALVKERNKLEGPRSLHRGLHLTVNEGATRTFKTRSQQKAGDGATGATATAAGGHHEKRHRDLLVHHQKITEDLHDLYHRTSQLHKENLTMEERIEEGWRDFEQIGGRVPPKVSHALRNARERKEASALIKCAYGSNRGSNSASLCVAPGAVPYAERLQQLSAEKKQLQDRARWERTTRGEAVDYGEGSALHALKDRRIHNFQQRQLARAHKLRRYGDPTPLKQSGRFDDKTATLRVFNKTIRGVRREVAQDQRVAAVKEPRRKRARTESHDGNSSLSGGGGRARSQWDVRGTGNVNRPETEMVRYSRDAEIGWVAGGGNRKRKRS